MQRDSKGAPRLVTTNLSPVSEIKLLPAENFNNYCKKKKKKLIISIRTGPQGTCISLYDTSSFG